MFVRARTRARVGRDEGSSVTYYQAVESYRDEAGRPRHRVLASWNDRSDGPTVADAVSACEKAIAAARTEAREWRSALANWPEMANQNYHPFLSRHRNVIERDALKAERCLAREEARLLALRKVAALK